MNLWYLKPHSNNLLLIDNSAVVSSLKKARGADDFANELIKTIQKTQQEKDINLKFAWVSTHEQKADAATRDKYIADKFALSEAGIKKVRKILEKEPELDLFSSPKDNVFKIPYCSLNIIKDDDLNMKHDAFEYMKLMAQSRIEYKIWCYPPVNLIIPLAKVLHNFILAEDAYIAWLVPTNVTTELIPLLLHLGVVSSRKFCCKFNKFYFRSKSNKAFALVLVRGKASEETSISKNKRFRLR